MVLADEGSSDQSSKLPSPEEAERQDTTRSFMDLTQRRELYEVQKKSHLKAAGLSLLVPGLGNVYTEQYFIAAIAMSLGVFALVFAGYALTTDQPEFFIWSAVTAGVAYGTGITTSLFGVTAYNRDLRIRLKVPEKYAGMPSNGVMLSFSLPF